MDKEKNIAAFLKGVHPFDALTIEELRAIAGEMAEETFSPGEFILKQDMHGLTFYVIRSGLVRVHLSNGEAEEELAAFLGEGDCFGEISLLTDRPTTATIRALEKTTCIVQFKDTFRRMISRYPLLADFFNQLVTERTKNNYRGIAQKASGIGHVETYVYSRQVKDMVTPGTGFINEKSTIKQAAQLLLQSRTGPRVVVDDRQNLKGIIGTHTLIRSTLLDAIDSDSPVSRIMEKEFHCISGDAYFFDALHAMLKYNTGTLVVMKGDKVTGVVRGSDLLRFRGREALSLLRNIEQASDFTRLNGIRMEVEKVLRELMNEGALASHACRIVSEFNDRVVQRVIQLAQKECGPAPCPYAWLGMGSEGRKEQSLFTDQDNGIVFSERGAEEYFEKLSRAVVSGLNQCGIPLCKGGAMATNPKFSGNLEDWKTRISTWISSRRLTEQDLMERNVFLDFRSVYGQPLLERELKDHMFDLIRRYPSCLKSMADELDGIPIPIGFFKNLIVKRSGEHRNRLNIKIYGLVPLVGCVKVLALHFGVHSTNTLERIEGLTELKVISNDQKEMIAQAFETFLGLRIKNNLLDIERGQTFGNYINPRELTTRQKQMLKEGFWTTNELQKMTMNTLHVSGNEYPVVC